MSKSVAKYNPDLNSHADVHPHCDELRLLSINEARDILKIRHETVRRLIDEGKIEVIVIGKRFKIPMKSLYRFIEENTRRAAAEDERNTQTDPRDILNNKIESIIKKHTR